MKLSAIVKASICLVGVFGVGNALIAPASADQAAARAAFTVTNPSSYTESVSAEVLLPKGLYFGGAGGTFIVTPSSTAVGGAMPSTITSLALDAGAATVMPAGTGASLTQAVVDKLGTTTNVEEYSAILKAAVGAGGLE